MDSKLLTLLFLFSIVTVSECQGRGFLPNFFGGGRPDEHDRGGPRGREDDRQDEHGRGGPRGREDDGREEHDRGGNRGREDDRNDGRGRNDFGGRGGGGGRGVWKMRERKKDILEDLSGWTKGVLNPREFRRTARKFCRRFPGHPKCVGGRSPSITDIGAMVESVNSNRGRFLPRVKKLHLKDPLAGVSASLVEETRKIRRHFGEIDADSVNKMRGVCKRRKCKEQDEETKKKKELVLNKIYEFENNLTGEDTSEKVQLRMDRTHQIKQVLLERANLSDTVVAADDGVFDKDLLLTEEQQTWILNRLDQGGVGTDEPPPPPLDDSDSDSDDETASAAPARQKRASIFFEENLIQKWDISKPIEYNFDESLEELDKNDVRQALAEIQAKTCIKFVYNANPRSYHLNYLRVDSATFCGLSYVGRVSPANPIYLSFQCGNSRGVALHETMHALGVAHQHLRMDRDQHITVDWSNINPQYYDTFAVSDSKLFTSYGVKYDYGSIMHYNAYTAAIDASKPTMIPKINAAQNLKLLGQRDGMSANDVTILKKMYCSAGCAETNVFCGAWALKDLCTAPANAGYLQANCKKSCNLCTVG